MMASSAIAQAPGRQGGSNQGGSNQGSAESTGPQIESARSGAASSGSELVAVGQWFLKTTSVDQSGRSRITEQPLHVVYASRVKSSTLERFKRTAQSLNSGLDSPTNFVFISPRGRHVATIQAGQTNPIGSPLPTTSSSSATKETLAPGTLPPRPVGKGAVTVLSRGLSGEALRDALSQAMGDRVFVRNKEQLKAALGALKQGQAIEKIIAPEGLSIGLKEIDAIRSGMIEVFPQKRAIRNARPVSVSLPRELPTTGIDLQEVKLPDFRTRMITAMGQGISSDAKTSSAPRIKIPDVRPFSPEIRAERIPQAMSWTPPATQEHFIPISPEAVAIAGPAAAAVRQPVAQEISAPHAELHDARLPPIPQEGSIAAQLGTAPAQENPIDLSESSFGLGSKALRDRYALAA